jgi:transposase-like protein
MHKDWLAARLDAGDSIEAIARQVDRDPSTVAYWVNKRGLQSRHAARHAPRGGLRPDQLEPLIEGGLTIRQIAAELDRSTATVRHWLKRHGLKTTRGELTRRDGSTAIEVIRDCPRHGWTRFRKVGTQTHYRCAQCVIDAVANARHRIRRTLVDSAGGKCTLCGYDRHLAALQFHHLDRADQGVHASERRYAISRPYACGGCEVRAAVRELPRGGRVRRGTASRTISIRVALRGSPVARSGVAQSAERAAVNR